MKTLILYDSAYGNTKRLALRMAEALSAYGPVHTVPVTEIDQLDHPQWDILLLGGPTQMRRVSPPLSTLLSMLPRRALRGRYTAVFDTRYQKPRWLTGSAAGQLAIKLRRAGATLLLPPESFFVEATKGPLLAGEPERAARWASRLHTTFEQAQRLKQQQLRPALI